MASPDPNEHPINGDMVPSSIGRVPNGPLRRPGANSMNSVDEITARTSELTVNNSPSSNGPSSNGPSSNGPSSNGPSSNGPSSRTGLNPMANEFVPTFALPKPSVQYFPPSIPHQGAGSRNTNGTSQGWSANNTFVSNDLYNNDPESDFDDYFALSELKEFIDQVSSTPGAYDSYIHNVTEVLNNCIDEDEDVILQCIVNLIVDQAITDQNFRYNGMRLCEHLIENLNLRNAKGSFKDQLLKRCGREHLRRDSLARTTEGGNYLRGVTLFVADLSTRLPEKELTEYIPDLINTLLSNPTLDNIKTVCLVLKLCGPNLEKYFSGRSVNNFEIIMSKLKTMSEDGAQEGRIVDVITNVLEMRGRGWKAPPPPAGLFNPYLPENMAPETAAAIGGEYYEDTNGYYPYDPSYSNGYADYGTYDFGPCGDEQDSDVVDAFEQFLASSGQK